MQRYLTRRLLLAVPTLLGATFIIFLILRALPGDVALLILVGPSGEGTFDQKQYEHLREQLGLNDPLVVQYGKWLGGMLRGDWGKSLWSKKPVLEELGPKFLVTLELVVLVKFVALAIALPIGILAALHQDSWVDYVLRVFAITGLSAPSFWVGIVILMAGVYFWSYAPPFYETPWANPGAHFALLLFPVVAQGYRHCALLSRMTRSQMLEVLREDYIRTAHAKGLDLRQVTWRHTLKNALLPVLTLFGVEFAYAFGALVVIETLFNIPGMAGHLVNAVHMRDLPVVQGTVTIIALIVIFTNLGVDLLYGWADPRIRFA